MTKYGPVAQLVRALACHARGREFKSLPDRHYVSIAQSVEQRTENPCVGGSIPLRDTKLRMWKRTIAQGKSLIRDSIPLRDTNVTEVKRNTEQGKSLQRGYTSLRDTNILKRTTLLRDSSIC